MEYQKEEIQSRRRGELNFQSELTHFRKEVERLQAAVEKLNWYKQEYTNLTRANESLKQDLSGLQDQFDNIICEKADLESHNMEVVRALNEEREARNELTQRLREDALHSPTQLAWAEESAGHLLEDAHVSNEMPTPESAYVNKHMAYSTPHAANSAAPSLLSELQTSLLSSVDAAELDSVHQKLREAEEDVKNLQLQKSRLVEEVRSRSAAAQEMEQRKEAYKQSLEEKERELESVKDDLAAKSEQVGQLKGKLSSVMGEKASMEIELDGLKDELQRERAALKVKLEKYEKELVEELRKGGEVQKHVSKLEEKLSKSTGQLEKLETVLANSSEELVAMRDEMSSLYRTVLSLNHGKVDPSQKLGVNGEMSHSLTANENNAETVPETYIIAVQDGKRRLEVHTESHTLLSALHLWDQLRLLRGPLEQFTRTMLQRSLAVSTQHVSTRHISTSTDRIEEDVDNKRVSELEAEMKKLKSRLMTRSEEASQLRTIMKARQTTVDVTISSLKSKLEGQARAHEAEVNQLKHKIKTLRKERDDQISLGAMTARRCQDHMEEIGRIKKKMEDLRAENEQMKVENKLVNLYLERAIRQKIEISVQLEQYQEEEERTRLIPVALSASRV